jgi:protein SCO1
MRSRHSTHYRRHIDIEVTVMPLPVVKTCARRLQPTLLGLLMVCGSFLPCAATAAPRAADEQAVRWPGGNDYRRSVRTYATPDVLLTDGDARPVRLRELLATDDPVMMNFVFTTCSAICPVMVKVFADVPVRLGAAAKNLRMISISIDPDNDTPAQLKAYSKQFGAGARWQFLTGRPQDVRAVQLAFDGYRGDKMNHEPLTLMRHGSSKPWVRIDGFANPDELVREYERDTSR